MQVEAERKKRAAILESEGLHCPFLDQDSKSQQRLIFRTLNLSINYFKHLKFYFFDNAMLNLVEKS